MNEPFVVKYYVGDARPSIKGNGFDGLSIGDERDEAEGFIGYINRLVAAKDAEIAQLRVKGQELNQLRVDNDNQVNQLRSQITNLQAKSRLDDQHYNELAAERDQLRERLARFEPKPIDTAPQEGDMLLMHIIEGRLFWAQAGHRGKGVTRALWFSLTGKGLGSPTHWMPLPEVTP